MRHGSWCGQVVCLYAVGCLALASVVSFLDPTTAHGWSGLAANEPSVLKSDVGLPAPAYPTHRRTPMVANPPKAVSGFTPTVTATAVPASPPAPWVTVLREGFEGPFHGSWEVSSGGTDAGQYLWGKRSCLPYHGSHSGWAVGGGEDGEPLPCDARYPPNVDSWMVFGPFSLADARAAELRFQLRLNSEAGFDEFFAGASLDGRTFYGLWASGSQEWTARTLDLTRVPTLGNLAGQAEVWIALTFSSDADFEDTGGAYVDDIVLRKCPGHVCLENVFLPYVEQGSAPFPPRIGSRG